MHMSHDTCNMRTVACESRDIARFGTDLGLAKQVSSGGIRMLARDSLHACYEKWPSTPLALNCREPTRPSAGTCSATGFVSCQ